MNSNKTGDRLSSTSIDHRIRKVAKERQILPQLVRTEFLLERLMARLAKSPASASSIVFKGGVVSKSVYCTGRFTRDIDLSPAPNQSENIIEIIKTAIPIDLTDGCWFKFKDEAPLVLQSPEGGMRLRVLGGIGKPPAKIEKATTLSIDITFSPVEQSHWANFSPLLGGKSFRLQVCAAEVTVADKLSALLNRTLDNTRSRDVYDLSKMLPQVDAELVWERLNLIFRILKKEPPSDLIAALNAVDPRGLKRNWSEGVLGINNPPTFEESWNQMLKHLIKIQMRPQLRFRPGR